MDSQSSAQRQSPQNGYDNPGEYPSCEVKFPIDVEEPFSRPERLIEGAEPPETEDELEPEGIEYAGVKWATNTSRAWCDWFSKEEKLTEGEKRKCELKLLDILLDKREKWERGTWEGVKGFIKKAISEE